jgi:hypothetical protein
VPFSLIITYAVRKWLTLGLFLVYFSIKEENEEKREEAINS